MAISGISNFARPVATQTTTKTFAVSGVLAEQTNQVAVDITTVVTLDNDSTVTKTIGRILIPVTINGTTLKLGNASYYIFPGTATNYSAGGLIPALSAGVPGQSVELSGFLTQAGDTPEDPA